ncbi:hypothetical protein [Mycobacteroides chelonae]|uniref:hypothetical protein n=1 Tax=Mycobacteroides chelonae TaxID=1774 RepID=UPI0009932DDB|nr:hypothetical protein [Mycobacteroides chelonae]
MTELTAEMEEAIESIVDGWYPSGPVDWHDFLDRLESTTDVDLGTDMLSPTVKAIKRYALKYRGHV